MRMNEYQNKSHRQIITEKMQREGYGERDVQEMLDYWEKTQSLVPHDFDEKMLRGTCLFCINVQTPAEKYAHTVLAHPEPATFKSLFGLGQKKFQSEVGSLLPVAIPICSHCEKAIRKPGKIKALAIVVSALLAVALIAGAYYIPQVAQNIIAKLVFYSAAALLVVVGYLVGAVSANRYVIKNSDKERFNIFDIELFKKMREDGWFLLQNDSSPATAMNYSKDAGDFGRVFDEER